MASNPPATPVLDKRNAVLAESNRIGQFLDWLSAQGIHLAQWRRIEGYRDEQLWETTESFDSLLHRYFEIDPVAEENEKLAILEHIRSLA